eukprot:Selendium_serpulae@DN6506_c1_g1_i10.p1
MAARLSRKKWAEKQSRTILHKALLAFELNSHMFDTDSTALFKLGSKLSHSCWSNSRYSSSVVEGHGCHVALRPIAEGEIVTTDYLGDSYLYGFPLRQEIMFEQKAFRCRCARCLGVDRARSVPCPGCHPHDSDGSLSDEVLQPEATVSYAVAQAGGVDEWRCEGCGKVWSGEKVFPQSASEEELWSKAFYKLAQELDVNPSIKGETLRTMRYSLSRSLGYRHWATIKMLDIENQFCIFQFKKKAPSTVRKGLADKVVANNDFIWRYCAASHSLPAAFHNSFSFLVRGLLGAGFSVPPRILLRTLACHSLMFSGDTSLKGAAGRTLSQCGMPIRGVPAADKLKQAGNESFQDGNYGEAYLYYRAAIIHHPEDSKILSNLAATCRKLNLHEEAVASSKACVHYAPTWFKGHFHLSGVLVALGKIEEAKVAARHAAELEPSNPALPALLRQINEACTPSVAKMKRTAKTQHNTA